MKDRFRTNDRSSEQLDRGRRANAERECHEASCGKNRLRQESRYGSELRLQQADSGFRSRRMGGHTDGTFGRFGTIGVMMRSESNC